MNRKYKFPCANIHYIKSDKKDSNGNYVYWNKEELAKMYDSYCADCRETYKYYDRYILFVTKFWDFHFSFTYPRWNFYKHIYQYQGLKEALKIFFGGMIVEYSNPEFAHAYWYTWFHLFMFHWREYEFYDIYNDEVGYIDLDNLREYHYKKYTIWEYNRQHQVEVLKRYNRMFGSKIRKNHVQN